MNIELEEFIEEQKQNEIKRVDQEAKKLPEAQRARLYAWDNFTPWEEIFTDRLRASFLISLVSFLEIFLNQVCKDVAIVVRSPLKSSEIKGNMLERSQKFLEVFGNFTRPSKEDWEFIGRIYDVRNAFVHVNGSIDDYRDARRLRQFIEQQPGLSGISYLELKKEFCFSCLEKIEAFLEMICSEVRNLCERIKRFESKK